MALVKATHPPKKEKLLNKLKEVEFDDQTINLVSISLGLFRFIFNYYNRVLNN